MHDFWNPNFNLISWVSGRGEGINKVNRTKRKQFHSITRVRNETMTKDENE